MRRRPLSELVELMQPSPVELYGDDAPVGPDVVLDNRNATDGALFVAVPGNRVDGHDFAAAAVEAGAAAVMGTRETGAGVGHLLVPDTVTGLSHLARGVVREARERGLVSVGITGSSGKTSTKDLVASVLETCGATVAPAGSQNNEIGVPLTACRVDDETRFLVNEMGARGIGHIAWLTSLVPLDVAVVLNVGLAHVGEFGGIEQTTLAKGELVEGLAEDGWAVLNADDPNVAGMATRTRAQLAWFGEGEQPNGALHVQARDVTAGEFSRPAFRLLIHRGDDVQEAQVQLAVVGRHQVSNALAAAAVGVVAGMDAQQIADALAGATPRSQWRMELHHRPDGVLVLNDAYNANPDSTAAALRTAVELRQLQLPAHPGARVVAVIGDMLELGASSDDEHARVAEIAATLGVDEIIAVGEHAASVLRGALAAGVSAQALDRDDVASALQPAPGDVVLVKGSRGIGLEIVADELVRRGEAL